MMEKKPKPKKPVAKKTLKKKPLANELSKGKPGIKKINSTHVSANSQKTSPQRKARKISSSDKVVRIEDFVYRVKVGSRSSVYLVGTAHVSKKSIELVKQTLDRYRPQTVYLELDAERKDSLTRSNYRDINILKIIKEKKILFFMFYLLMGIIQKKIAEKYGTRPGGEFLAALEWANENDREVVLIDRGAQITVKRTWRSMGVREQLRFLFSGLLSVDEGETFDVENMREDDLLTDMIKKLGVRFPKIKRIVIDERDEYMGVGILRHVEESEGVSAKKKGVGLAVVGAGHLVGLRAFLETPSDRDLHAYEQVPPPHFFWQAVPWVFTGIVFLVFLVGFWFTDWTTVRDAFVFWALITGGLSALGSLLAGGHPLTVLTALISAPLTTLHPVLGVGFFTAIVQFYFCPPRIRDFETLSLKLGKIRFWWKNRVTRIFLVFFFSSLGAGVGMWIALSKAIAVFS